MPREGMIPTLLGTAVTASGIAMRVPDIRRNGVQRNQIVPMVATGLIGFGLAHIVLGTIDLVQENRQK